MTQQARIIDLTRRSQLPDVRLEASTAVELLVGLDAFSNQQDRSTYESGEEWFEKVESRIAPGLRRSLDRLGSDACKLWHALGGLLLEDQAVLSAADFVQRLRETSALEVRKHLLGFYMPAHHGDRGVTTEEIGQAAAGDPGAQRRLLADPHFNTHYGRALPALLAMDAEETKTLALEVLEGWYEDVLKPDEAEIQAILERDVESKRSRLAGRPAVDWVVGATGIEYVPESGIEHLVLLPQVAMRPWVMITETGDTRVYCYPVADESLAGDAAAPPARLVRLHRALGDEKRLRLLRILADRGPATLQELADQVGIAKSTTHHHLVQLRSAGLAQVTPGDEWRWHLRADAIPDASTLLDAYLRPGEQARRTRR